MIGVTLRHAERTRRARAREFPALTAQLLYLELGLFAFLVAGVFGSFAKLSFVYLHIAMIWALAEDCRTSPAEAGAGAEASRLASRGGWRLAAGGGGRHQ